jgi:capsular polysaccharide biosynthesis protein
MDLAEVVRVIRARWYVLLPLLLLTAALAVGVDKSIPTKYQATSSITLLSSQSATAGTSALPGNNNVFLNFDSSLNDTADFLVRRLGSADAANDLGGRGVTEAYSVVLAAGAQGPFISLSVTGTNREHALTSMNTLIAYTEQELTTVQQQAGIKQADMIRAMVIVPPGPPSPQTKAKTQDVLGVGIGGLVVTFLLTFLVDNIVTSRRRKGRSPRSAAAAQPGQDGRGDAAYGSPRDYDYGDGGYNEGGYDREGYDADGAESEQPAPASASASDAPTASMPRRNGSAARRASAADEELPGSAARSGLGGSRWYGLDDDEPALERDAFEPARPELTGRGAAPSPRD